MVVLAASIISDPQPHPQRRRTRISFETGPVHLDGFLQSLAAEQEASARRLRRWLSQSKVKAADAERALAAEAAVYEAAARALEGARLELDQAALVQLA